jgi:hypothetical protein
MNTRHSSKISRSTAEQLLDGHAAPDLDQLTRVLSAAAAPARDSELAGEQMAVAAFEANRLVPFATPQKERKSMLAKLLTAKVIVASMATLATGGVALAASGALPGTGSPKTSSSQPATSPTTLSTPFAVPSSGAGTPPTHSPNTPIGAGTGTQPPPVTSPTTSAAPAAGPSGTASPAATSQSLPQSATALCQALIGDVVPASGGTLSQSGELAALSSSRLPAVLNSSEFAPLVATTQSAGSIPDYCALLLDLPQIPDPSALVQLPSSVLTQLLTALPASTLSQVLTALPSSALSTIVSELPTSTVSQLLSELPTSIVAQLLSELPTSIVSQLLSELPTSVLSQLPASLLSGL